MTVKKTFMLIAWRNVRRNGRRSFLTILITSIGLATLIISNALYDGFHEKMVDSAVRIAIGHIRIQAHDFQRNPMVNKFFDPGELEGLEDIPHVRARTERVRFQALASTAANSQAVVISGIDSYPEKEVTVLQQSILEGRYLSADAADSHNCLVGEQLFKNLGMEMGERIVAMSQSFDGSLAADAFRVTGIVRTGNPEIDRSFVWIPLSTAQMMLNYGNNVSKIVFLLDSADRVSEVKSLLIEKTEKSGQNLDVLDWKEIAPDIVQLMSLNIAMQRILTGVIAIIVAVAIMNSMLISIQERFCEFGIMSTIGTQPRQIIGMVLWESFFLGMLGIAGGLVLSTAGFIFFYNHGVNLASFSDGVSQFIGLDTTVYPILKLRQVMISGFIVLASSTFISIFPAFRAANMDTIQAIRHI